MLILALESSAVAASAAVMEDQRLLGEFFVNTKQTHSQTLLPMVENLLLSLGKKFSEFDLMAVSSGPGSFTGIRIGVSCVKGMAFADNITCCGVSTLEAIAYGALALENKIICPVMDARCNQVYNGLFRSENGRMRRLCEDRAISIEHLCAELKEKSESVVVIGDGATLCHSKMELANTILMPEAQRYQRASSVAVAALFSEHRVLPSQLVPTYLRPPQAERELKKRTAERNGGK